MKVQDRTPERLGPYRLIRRLGEGGMGVVYLAVDGSQVPVAVKALHPGMAQEENARRRLAREVETMRRVRSPYVAEVLDADLYGDVPYIVTRYVPGMTLDGVVGAGGPLAGPGLARLASGLAQALAAVHAAGVVHRDLKPGNVMICDGEPVVIDFGIAQLPEATRLTITGMFMGTPGYLAPEVIEGKDSGTASDVHSLGATLAYAATGRPPFGTGAFETVFYRIMHGSPDIDTMPAPLRPVVLSALARDPASRPSAAELAQRLAFLDPATLVPSPPAPGPLGDGSGAGGGAPGPNGLPRTAADELVRPAWPGSTRPLQNSVPADHRDLLPPVVYGAADSAPGGTATAGAWPAGGWPAGGTWPAGAGAGGAMPGGAGPGGAGPGGAGPGRGAGATVADLNGSANAGQAGRLAVAGGSAGEPAAAGAVSRISPVSTWSPLVFAVVAMLVAIGVMAPIIGTGIALAVLVGLRAATTTGRQLAKRRGTDGHRASDPVVAAAFYPVALLRALIGLVLLAPVALLGFCVAAAATIIVVPVHPLPRALALGAGALVAIVGLGPGSGSSRAALASLFSTVARTPSRRGIAYLGIVAIALWAGVSAWSQAQAPAYWPLTSLHVQLLHLPTIRTVLTDVRLSLLRFARHLGL